jgi:hypothetical protein
MRAAVVLDTFMRCPFQGVLPRPAGWASDLTGA